MERIPALCDVGPRGIAKTQDVSLYRVSDIRCRGHQLRARYS